MRTIIKAIFSFTAISFLSLSAFYETSAAREIEISEAVGLVRLYSGEEKQAKDGALREAMKSAVEQGVGAVRVSPRGCGDKGLFRGAISGRADC